MVQSDWVYIFEPVVQTRSNIKNIYSTCTDSCWGEKNHKWVAEFSHVKNYSNCHVYFYVPFCKIWKEIHSLTVGNWPTSAHSAGQNHWMLLDFPITSMLIIWLPNGPIMRKSLPMLIVLQIMIYFARLTFNYKVNGHQVEMQLGNNALCSTIPNIGKG